ncbi:MAG: tRNA (N(6)-L-threonylcarbamoyladenosine(37)-C(2))-methylthiotransferase MtaB [Capsulimonadaceae bacterium]|nr:tRNA (N(6)-L-threonylcarbamoyladenosine(37)-C(2))-methylthiotransferase MtaB [Capsulimonadaceae bacterium]
MPTAAFANLGCKVNQYEIERIAETFSARGFEITEFNKPADVYVINTCSVTGAADRKSRQIARRAARQKPGAHVVLTGCFAQLALDTGEGVEGASLLVPNREKMRVADHTLAAFPELAPAAFSPSYPITNAVAVFPEDAGLTPTGSRDLGRTRATLKVQDGCVHFCAFCSIPYTRGVMASRPLAAVLDEARQAAHAGVREVVVTGVCVGAYRDGGNTLTDVLIAVADVPGIERVRLSSIQPIETDQRLIDAVASHPNICHHLHLSLQSGSDLVLRAMQRPYDTAYYRDLVRRLRAAAPGIAITTDIIVGFPGETPDEFARTLAFAEEMAFARTHVFRYSPRRRTYAAEHLRDDVSDGEKEARHQALTAVSIGSQRAFAEQIAGGDVDVLVESRGKGAGLLAGYTSAYIRVHFATSTTTAIGDIVPVHIDSIDAGGDAIGQIATPFAKAQ